MQITREILQKKIAEYQAAEQQMLANANANAGARQELERLLSLLGQPETASPERSGVAGVEPLLGLSSKGLSQ